MKYIRVFEARITFEHPDFNLYNDIKESINLIVKKRQIELL
jgi:hypothetical protein